MGILNTIAKTAAKKVLIETTGDVALKAAGSVMDYKEKNVNTYVFTPESSESFVGQNYEEVRAKLCAYGFTNITLLEKKDLILGLLTRVGSVEEVSINGKSKFRKKAKFHYNSRVVIVYHSYR